jgi:energy-converting hydrogenase A subunit D
MTDLILILAVILSLIGGIATVSVRSPFDKLICLGILTSGGVLFMVAKGYLDVAICIALLMPIGTLFILLLLGKKQEVPK